MRYQWSWLENNEIQICKFANGPRASKSRFLGFYTSPHVVISLLNSFTDWWFSVLILQVQISMFQHESTCIHFLIKLLYRLMILSLEPLITVFKDPASQPSQPTQPAQNAENAEKCSLPCKNAERHQIHFKNNVKSYKHTKTYTKPMKKCRTASKSL